MRKITDIIRYTVTEAEVANAWAGNVRPAVKPVTFGKRNAK